MTTHAAPAHLQTGIAHRQSRAWRLIHLGTDLLIILAFVVALGLPMVGTGFQWGQSRELGEKRPMASVPRLASLSPHELLAFTEAVRKAFRDRFGFRTLMIEWQSYLKYKWLGAPSSYKVVIGEKGWLFFTDDRSVENFVKISPYSPAELDQLTAVFERRAQWLADRGAKYVLTVAPAKETIYPEFMPAYLRNRRENVPSRFDQLAEKLKGNGKVHFVDVRPAMLKAKQSELLYKLTDTHWNERGAYAAYQEIIRVLNDDLQLRVTPVARSSFSERPVEEPGGDLAMMLGIRFFLSEEDILLIPDRVHAELQNEIIRSTQASPDIPRAVLIGDSFLPTLAAFLVSHIGQCTLVGSDGFDPARIERERPTLVIQELAERKLMRPVPKEQLSR